MTYLTVTSPNRTASIDCTLFQRDFSVIIYITSTDVVAFSKHCTVSILLKLRFSFLNFFLTCPSNCFNSFMHNKGALQVKRNGKNC